MEINIKEGCAQCGHKYDGLSVGCLACYQNKIKVDGILRRLQGETRHIGKTPYTMGLNAEKAAEYYIARYEAAVLSKDISVIRQAAAELSYIRLKAQDE